MVTRRPKKATHARPSAAARRRAARRAAAKEKPLYVGGSSSGPLGGRVGNIAGFGAGEGASYNDGTPSIDNVAGYGTDSADVKAHAAHRRASGGGRHAGKSPTPRAQDTAGGSLVSRRAFLYGAIGVGTAAAVGGGVAAYLQQHAEDEADDEFATLEVPEDAVTASDTFTEVDASTRMELSVSAELPFGTLVWCSDDTWAACLVPTEQSSPFAQIGLFDIASGDYAIVLDQAVGTDEGFEIYDVRAASAGVVWTEADILDGTWRVYTAPLSGGELGEPVLAEEGEGADWDTPTIAAVGSFAFWQVKPKSTGSRYSEGTALKRVGFGSDAGEVVLASRGRSATAPYALDDGLVVTPRLDSSTIYYQLTLIDAEGGDALDAMTLPSSMTPLEAGYGQTGFMFSFENIYSYGDGIANLGTYVPLTAVEDGAYSEAPWFHFVRTPTAAPAWCGGLLMVKSTTQVCGFDLDAGEYFALDLESGCDDYGEYLATTGTRDAIVTFTSVDDNPINGDERQCCVVKVWRALDA